MENKLVGWDDGKLYFYNDSGKEHCVNDYKELFDKIVELCVEYFRKREIKGKRDED